MGHIRLSREADLVVVAPATADLMAKMAAGLADDLASTAAAGDRQAGAGRAGHEPADVGPPGDRRNVARLRADGVRFVGPNPGDMACGEVGAGRMAEPHEILAAIERPAGARRRPLAGRGAVVTSGPTREPLDPVRYSSNRSSGQQGHAIARPWPRPGAEVTLVSGPVAVPGPAGRRGRVTSRPRARCWPLSRRRCRPISPSSPRRWPTGARPRCRPSKIKNGGRAASPAIELVENPDILRTRGAGHWRRGRGWSSASRPRQGIWRRKARAKLARKGCDWILANDVSPGSGVFGGDAQPRSCCLTGDGTGEAWPELDKFAVARRLVAADRGAARRGPEDG